MVCLNSTSLTLVLRIVPSLLILNAMCSFPTNESNDRAFSARPVRAPIRAQDRRLRGGAARPVGALRPAPVVAQRGRGAERAQSRVQRVPQARVRARARDEALRRGAHVPRAYALLVRCSALTYSSTQY